MDAKMMQYHSIAWHSAFLNFLHLYNQNKEDKKILRINIKEKMKYALVVCSRRFSSNSFSSWCKSCNNLTNINKWARFSHNHLVTQGHGSVNGRTERTKHLIVVRYNGKKEKIKWNKIMKIMKYYSVK